MKIALIVPAAGSSTRFGTSDKLAQDLNGRPVLLRAIEPFTKRTVVSTIIVAGPAGAAFEEFKNRFGPTLGFHGAIIVEGGTRDRWESVKNAIAAVPDDVTHIAVHDAARPCPPTDMLDRLLHAAEHLDAVVPGVAMSDTLKRVDTDGHAVDDADDASIDAILGDAGKVSVMAYPIIETVDRNALRAIQTPQIFSATLLRQAYEADDLDGCTDDASVVERTGTTVHVVDGDPANIKITSPGDLAIARALLGGAPAVKPSVDPLF